MPYKSVPSYRTLILLVLSSVDSLMKMSILGRSFTNDFTVIKRPFEVFIKVLFKNIPKEKGNRSSNICVLFGSMSFFYSIGTTVPKIGLVDKKNIFHLS